MAKKYHMAATEAPGVAEAQGHGFPDFVNGVKAYYYWRPSIRDGNYTHPVKGWSLNVDAERRARLAATFTLMRERGVAVPICTDHKVSADTTLGYVVAMRQNGPWLEELHQYLGEASRDVALKNFVSVGIDPAFKDGIGNEYGDTIVHSAIVPDPVVPGQGSALLAASLGTSDDDLFVLGVGEAQPAYDQAWVNERIRCVGGVTR